MMLTAKTQRSFFCLPPPALLARVCSSLSGIPMRAGSQQRRRGARLENGQFERARANLTNIKAFTQAGAQNCRSKLAPTARRRGRDMRSDSDIKRDVEAELQSDPSIDASDIAVAVKNGVVTLTGFVRSYAEKLEAEAAAKRVASVVGLA